MENANKILITKYTPIELPYDPSENMKLFSVKLQVGYWLMQKGYSTQLRIDFQSPANLYVMQDGKNMLFDKEMVSTIKKFVQTLDTMVFPIYKIKNLWEKSMLPYVAQLLDLGVQDNNTMYMTMTQHYEFIYEKIYYKKLNEIKQIYEELYNSNAVIMPSPIFIKTWGMDLIDSKLSIGIPNKNAWKCFEKIDMKFMYKIMANEPIKFELRTDDLLYKYTISKELDKYGLLHHYYYHWIYVKIGSLDLLKRVYEILAQKNNQDIDIKYEKFSSMDTCLFYTKDKDMQLMIRDYTTEQNYIIFLN